MADIIALCAEGMAKSQGDKELTKIYVCDHLLEIVKKMKGKELAPYLSNIDYNIETRKTALVFLM